MYRARLAPGWCCTAKVTPSRTARPSALRALLHAASHGFPCVPLVASISANSGASRARTAWERVSTMIFKERVRRVTGVLGRTLGADQALVNWFDKRSLHDVEE